MSRRLAPALVAVLLASPVGGAQPASPPARRTAAPGSVDAFFTSLEIALERNDRSAVARLVHYPIKVLASGWIIPLDDSAALVRYFDAIFTDEIRDLIADASSRHVSARPSAVLTLGPNAVRIMRVNEGFRIIGISIPPASGRVRGARRGTTVVTFSGSGSGPTAKFAGTLGVGEHESYLVAAKRNDLLDVRIEGVRGRDIIAHVVNAASGAPVDVRAATGQRIWVGRVPAAGDYRIDIVRAVRGGDAVLTYTLAVSLR